MVRSLFGHSREKRQRKSALSSGLALIVRGIDVIASLTSSRKYCKGDNQSLLHMAAIH
jgi:hypothetical protein